MLFYNVSSCFWMLPGTPAAPRAEAHPDHGGEMVTTRRNRWMVCSVDYWLFHCGDNSGASWEHLMLSRQHMDLISKLCEELFERIEARFSSVAHFLDNWVGVDNGQWTICLVFSFLGVLSTCSSRGFESLHGLWECLPFLVNYESFVESNNSWFRGPVWTPWHFSGKCALWATASCFVNVTQTKLSPRSSKATTNKIGLCTVNLRTGVDCSCFGMPCKATFKKCASIQASCPRHCRLSSSTWKGQTTCWMYHHPNKCRQKPVFCRVELHVTGSSTSSWHQPITLGFKSCFSIQWLAFAIAVSSLNQPCFTLVNPWRGADARLKIIISIYIYIYINEVCGLRDFAHSQRRGGMDNMLDIQGSGQAYRQITPGADTPVEATGWDQIDASVTFLSRSTLWHFNFDNWTGDGIQFLKFGILLLHQADASTVTNMTKPSRTSVMVEEQFSHSHVPSSGKRRVSWCFWLPAIRWRY